MKQFEIFNWCGERKVNDVLNALGFVHGDVVDGDVFETARKFSDAGLSVMIMPLATGNSLLGLDTRSFGQR